MSSIQGLATKMGPFTKQKSRLMTGMWKAIPALGNISKRDIPSTSQPLLTKMQTTMSNYERKKRDEGMNPNVNLKYLETTVLVFNLTTEICQLCTHEQFRILLNPQVSTLIKKTEMCSSCRREPPD